MGTTYSITIKDKLSQINIKKSQIDSILVLVNNKFSTYDIDSEISKINSNNSVNIHLSNDFSDLLNKALYYCDISKGSYDITIGPLVKLWGFEDIYKNNLPSKKNINKYLNNIGYNKISLLNNVLYKKNKNIKLDLNSIAKGYAVDKVYDYLKSLGCSNFLIEIGGELRSMGYDWIVGIQNPSSNDIIHKIKLAGMSMATSGTYNNFFIYNDTSYSHIINPKSGYPYEYSLLSATIISKNCSDADAYATMALTMQRSKFVDLTNKMTGIECYIVEVINNKINEYKSLNFDTFITD